MYLKLRSENNMSCILWQKNPWHYLCQWDILIQRVVYLPFQKSMRVSVNLSLRCNYGIENKGIIVQSSAPITVMGNNQGGGSTQDVFLVNALRDISIQYLVVSPEPRRNEGIFTVISAYNGTSVAIWKPSPSGYVHWKTVELNRLDTFTFMEKTDPSGYKVISNRPVSVQSGSEKERISARMTYIDHMCVSLAPTLYNGGADYYIIPITIRNNPGAYHVKVVAVYNLTVVSDLKNSGNHIATLGAGQHLENGPVISGTPVTVLRCSKPCTVMQFNMGPSYDGTANIDAFQMWIPPLHHHIKYINFITPHNEVNTAMQNTLVILTWSAVTAKILVDGTSVNNWVEFWLGSDISYVSVSVNDGEHDIVYNGDSQYGFLAWLYGKDGRERDAYGTLLGVETCKCTIVYYWFNDNSSRNVMSYNSVKAT